MYKKNYNYKDYIRNFANFSIYFSPCTESETKSYIDSLKSNAAGYDDITAVVLKQSSNYISFPLTHIINLSFRRGVFRDKLKIAKAIPIHKAKCKSNINNFRLISILPSISKIFEKAIASRLSNYLENNNLLSNCQYGFRKTGQHNLLFCILYQRCILN